MDARDDAQMTCLMLAHAHVVHQLLAAGAKAELTDKHGMTALLLACALAHEAAAALLVEPTHAAGALDVVGDDGFSALLWAEERGLRNVAQRLRECGAVAVCRPADEDEEGRKGERKEREERRVY